MPTLQCSCRELNDPKWEKCMVSTWYKNQCFVKSSYCGSYHYALLSKMAQSRGQRAHYTDRLTFICRWIPIDGLDSKMLSFLFILFAPPHSHKNTTSPRHCKVPEDMYLSSPFFCTTTLPPYFCALGVHSTTHKVKQKMELENWRRVTEMMGGMGVRSRDWMNC